jgi:putative ABC transport system substrate-binding protein
MQRRDFITLLGGAAAAWPLTARAQQPERIRRVGVLTPYTKQYFVDRNDVAAFTNEFQRLGWEEGRNFHLEYRGVAPDKEQLRSAAADLVALKSEVILVVTSPALEAAQVVTNTIPIVFVGVTDPVDQGFIANLAHPGGNVTGFASFEYSIGSEWLHLLKEVSPDIRHFAVIFHPSTTPGGWLPLIRGVAPVLGLEVNEVGVNDDNEIDRAIDALKTSSDAGMIVLPSSFTRLHRQRIIDFAARGRAGVSGLRGRAALWHCRARRYAAADYRQAQCGAARGPGRSQSTRPHRDRRRRAVADVTGRICRRH